MNSFNQVKLLLISGILIICLGVIFISCGTDPQLKVADPAAGQCAIDFSRVPGTSIAVAVGGNAHFPSIAGDNITVEAWIKPGTADATAASGIFGRYGNAGVLMWVKDNIPKFAIRVAPTDTKPTSTDYTVPGKSQLSDVRWYHLAGVLADANHNAVHDPCTDRCSVTSDTICALDADCPVGETCVLSAETERPHIDLYIDGVFNECHSTNSNGVVDPSFDANKTANVAYIGVLPPALTPLVDGNASNTNHQLEGSVDEVRLWTVARSAADISACKDAELTSSGACALNSNILKGYWKMNECKGSDIFDWSGGGTAMGIEIGATPWTDGWVSETPF